MVEKALRQGERPLCPGCGDILEAEPGSRVSIHLVLDARAFDLACRACRRFWCCVQHTPRSLRLLRMRRLAAAVRAVELPRQPGVRLPLGAAASPSLRG
jgi:hypothetical protein